MDKAIKIVNLIKLLHFDQRRNWHKRNLKLLGKDCLILDVGCGRGDFASLSPNQIVAVDFNEVSLSFAKKRNIKYIIRATAFQLPFFDNSFNAIHCADLIEHFAPSDALTLLRELYRILKHEGTLLISTPMAGEEFWGDPSHIRPYLPQSIISLFVNAKNKGHGTNPTFNDIGHASLVGVHYRYRPLFRLPIKLITDETRLQIKNLIHPISLLYYVGNLLARIRILKFWSPAGYTLVLRKK